MGFPVSSTGNRVLTKAAMAGPMDAMIAEKMLMIFMFRSRPRAKSPTDVRRSAMFVSPPLKPRLSISTRSEMVSNWVSVRVSRAPISAISLPAR